MTSFNLEHRKEILIFELLAYRTEFRWNDLLKRDERKRYNSYAIYNAETQDLRIVNFDYLRTSVFDYSCRAYILKPGEKALVMKDFACYYLDEHGVVSEKVGEGWLFFEAFKVTTINEEHHDTPKKTVVTQKQSYPCVYEDYDFERNCIKHKDGAIYTTSFLLVEAYNNIIKCRQVLESGEWLFGICDCYGNLLSDIKYTDIWFRSHSIIRNHYFIVKNGDRFGLISFDGKEILPPQFDFVDDCDGEIAVVNHGKQLIRIKDLSIIYETKGEIHTICNGWMSVSKGYSSENTSNGILDKNGNFKKLFHKNNFGFYEEYDQLGSSISDGLLPIHVPNHGYGYVDVEGNEVIPCRYCEISDYHNGRAKVRLDCDYGFIDTSGRLLVKKGDNEIAIPNSYDWAYDFEDGYFIVQKGKLFGAIDEYFNEIIPCALKSKDEVENTISKLKLFCQKLPNEDYSEKMNLLNTPIRYEKKHLFGFKLANGSVICPPVLKVDEFIEDRAVISIGGHKGYINKKLELVIESKYDFATAFSEGLALVHEIGKGTMYINKTGEAVLTNLSQLEHLGPFRNGVVQCEYNRCQPGKDNDDYELTKFTLGYKTH